MTPQELETKVGVLESQQNGLKDDVRQLTDDVNETSGGLSALTTKVAVLQENVRELNTVITNEMQHKLDRKAEKRTLKDNLEVALLAVAASSFITILFHALGW